jgi:hypothetical protein
VRADWRRAGETAMSLASGRPAAERCLRSRCVIEIPCPQRKIADRRFRAVLSLPRNRLPGVQNFPIRTVAGTRVLPSSGRAGACGPGMIVGCVGSGVLTRRKGRFVAVQQHGIAGPGRCGALRPGRRSLMARAAQRAPGGGQPPSGPPVSLAGRRGCGVACRCCPGGVGRAPGCVVGPGVPQLAANWPGMMGRPVTFSLVAACGEARSGRGAPGR